MLKRIDYKSTIIGLYNSFVWFSYFYVHISTNIIVNIVLFIFIFICSYFVSMIVIRLLEQVKFKDKPKYDKKNKMIIFTCSTLITFGISLIWFLAYLPGSYSADSIYQYGQALTNNYEDWHPALHTILFFKLPLVITGNVASIVFLQIIYFSLVIGLATLTLSEIFNLKVAAIANLFIVLNPFVTNTLMYPWKDIAFALGGLACLIVAIRLTLLSHKQSLWKIIIFSALLAFTTIFRHNGIFFTLPLLFALIVNLNKKIWIKITLLFVIILIIVKIPLYGLLNVGSPTNRVEEGSGVPLTVLGNVVTKTPYAMNDELKDFAYSIAPQEHWVDHYVTGNYNTIKFTNINKQPIEEQGYLGMFGIMIQCFMCSPRASLIAFFELTDIVYGYEAGLKGNVRQGIAKNGYNIVSSDEQNESFLNLTTSYSDFVDTTIFKYLRTCGVQLFCLLVCVLINLNIKSKKSWKIMLFSLPIVFYDFGTMLLLSAHDARFFLITFLVIPFLIPITFAEK